MADDIKVPTEIAVDSDKVKPSPNDEVEDLTAWTLIQNK